MVQLIGNNDPKWLKSAGASVGLYTYPTPNTGTPLQPKQASDPYVTPETKKYVSSLEEPWKAPEPINYKKPNTIKVKKKQPEPEKKGLLLPDILGKPPEADNEFTYNLWRNSALVATIIPCISSFTKGTGLFKLQSAMGEYSEELSHYGYEAPDKKNGLQVCFQVDS